MKATHAITSLLRLAFSTLVEKVWIPLVEAPGGPNRVVFVTQMFPPEKGGNASRIHDTATSLQAGSWDVTVLAPPPTIPAGEFDRSWQRIRSETVDGVTIHRLWTPQPTVEQPSMARRLPYYLAFAIHATFWLLRNHRTYDVVVTSSPPISTGAPGVVAAAFNKLTIVDVRDLWIDAAISLGYIERDSVMERVSRAFQGLVLRTADLVTVTTETTSREVRDRYGKQLEAKTFVVPNGVDTDRFRPIDRATDGMGRPSAGDETPVDHEDRPTIIYTGNLGTAQDLEACVRAIAHMEDEEAILRLVGGGETESALRRLATELDVDDRVEFVGPVPRDAVPVYLSRATVGVAPLKDTQALSYAMPTKVYEYMACALPTVVTGRGEIDRFAERSPCVHAANDPERIAECIDELLADDDERRVLGESGRAHVRRRYQRDAIAERFDEKLSGLVDSPS